MCSEVRVEGLETLDYLDNLSQKERFTEQGDAITFESEVSPLLDMFLDMIRSCLVIHDILNFAKPCEISLWDSLRKFWKLIQKWENVDFPPFSLDSQRQWH